MFATDFLFDGQHASDLGFIICNFGEVESASGGEIEYTILKTPDKDKYTFYGSQFNSVITWKFSICKDPCKNKNMYFDQYEESMVAKWLLKTDGYRYLQFNQEGYEDIFYKVYFNISQHQINGKTIGFDLTATSNCAYGFTDIITIEKRRLDSSNFLKFNVHNDVNTYIYPIIKINRGYTMIGDFSIANYGDLSLTNPILEKSIQFKNIEGNIIIDSDIESIEGLKTPNDFNWIFMKLRDGMNIITTDSEIGFGIEIQYREIRYIKV